ncbi:calcium-binding protein [Inquilinus sp. OTU3971]|uniref:calcium-binding protein n=1 Tax=Inquilinus sp. OTU3971 TaxID=3043855 RepID=UPI00313C410C
MNVNLETGAGSGGDADGDSLDSIEYVIGSARDDFLIGSAGDNFLEASTGNDRIDGGGGSDTLFGDDGNDTLNGGNDASYDFLNGYYGNDTLVASGTGADRLDGGEDVDTVSFTTETGRVSVVLADSGDGTAVITTPDGPSVTMTLLSIENVNGTARADTIQGNGGANVLAGGAGDDILQGATGGGDTLDGGDGADTAVFTSTAHSVEVTLLYGRAGEALVKSGTETVSTDTLISIENVTGMALGDIISGDRGANVLRGVGGDDHLKGWAGNDTLEGGDGNDELKGGSGNDAVLGGDGDDVLAGNGGADTLFGSVGSDTLDGGLGVDIADYTYSDASVAVGLANGQDAGTASGGWAEGDTLTAIETVVGSGHDDTLSGNRDDNNLQGGGGTDTLDGNRGDDLLNGGAGADMLIGGKGADIFKFTAASDTNIRTTDTIADFNHGQKDKIDLSAIDAKSGTSANDAFSFIGTAGFSGKAGELRFTADGKFGTTVEGDLDGNGSADFRIALTGEIALVAKDFVL